MRRKRSRRTERVTVVPVRSGSRLLRAGAATCVAVLLVGAGYLAGALGVDHADSARATDVNESPSVPELNSSDMRMATVVEAGANERLRRTIKELRDKIGSLEEEARFYRRLVAPSEAERGFRIERLTISATREPSTFAYQLLLTQIADQHDWLEGDVEVEVSGERDGTVERHALAALAGEEGFAGGFRFLYFQELSGKLSLPEGFVPLAVTVAASVKEGARVRESFDWWVDDGGGMRGGGASG